jgi:hypothetical protein
MDGASVLGREPVNVPVFCDSALAEGLRCMRAGHFLAQHSAAFSVALGHSPEQLGKGGGKGAQGRPCAVPQQLAFQ